MLTNIGHYETLKEIYQLAEENDHLLQADKAANLADKESAAINRSTLLPQISGSVSVNDNRVDADNEPREDIDETACEVTLTQSIINASDWCRYRQDSTQSQLAAVRFAAAHQSLIFRTTEASCYLDLSI